MSAKNSKYTAYYGFENDGRSEGGRPTEAPTCTCGGTVIFYDSNGVVNNELQFRLSCQHCGNQWYMWKSELPPHITGE